MYTPFPIYDFRSGLQLNREPWLLPANAFTIAENCYCYNGRIYKRNGYEAFGQSSGGSGVTILNTPPVMGIFEYNTTGGASSLLALDKDFLYKYNTTNDDWEGQGGHPSTPDFTGDDDDFFWSVIWQDLIFFTNDVDNIKYWNGTTLAALNPSIGGTTLNACKILINHKNRLIALNTNEGGTRYPQRARCSNTGSYSSWSNDIYTDADTSEWIVSVAFIRNELIVFFDKSVWWLRYTGDASTPFSWHEIYNTDGSQAILSTQNIKNDAITLGSKRFLQCDGINVIEMDEYIPEFVLDMNFEKTNYAYGFLNQEHSQYFCTYPSQGASYPDKLLSYNYDDKCFSKYTNLPIHVTGEWSQGTTLIINDISVTIDNIGWRIDDRSQIAGYPLIIIGDRSGYTWKLFTTTSDNGASVPFKLKTKRLIPYPDRKAKLAYVDLWGISGVNTMNVRISSDERNQIFTSKMIDLYDFPRAKTRARIKVMQKSELGHTIEIRHERPNEPLIIDAIVPWFAPAGRLY
jgi:hypothetical protein